MAAVRTAEEPFLAPCNDFRFEDNRRASFRRRVWTGPPINFDDFARAGFYAVGGNEVACSSCNLRTGVFAGGDATDLHRRFGNVCPRVGDAVDSTTEDRSRDARSPDRTTPSHVPDVVASAAPGRERVDGEARLSASDRAEYLRKLKREAVRRQTFRNWTSPVVQPADLARAGFFYFNDRERVQCVFCLGIVERWEPLAGGETPAAVHRRLFPRCPFVVGLPVGNVPMDPVTGMEVRPAMPSQVPDGVDVTGLRVVDIRTNAEPERMGVVLKPGFKMEDLGIRAFPAPALPMFMTLEARLKTFKRWPRGLPQRPQQLAEAGLYYTGVSDEVKCFHCDGGLKGWEPNDDPWVEHAKWFPHCHLVNLLKGPEFVAAVKERSALSTNPAARQGKAEELMNEEPALTALGLGLDAGDVKRAILAQLEKHGRGFGDLNALLRASHCYAQERGDFEPHSRIDELASTLIANGDSGYSGSPLSAYVPSSLTEPSSEEPETSPPRTSLDLEMFELPEEVAPPEPETVEQPEDVEEVKSEDVAPAAKQRKTSEGSANGDKVDDFVCKICMENRIEVVLLPCGHLCSCQRCSSSSVNNCPMCRQKVAGFVRVYLS